MVNRPLSQVCVLRLSLRAIARPRRYPSRAVDHNFAGHAYSIGIEEELMILDAQSLELVTAIASLPDPSALGEIKPRLMESVLEISTYPCPTVPGAGQQLRALRGQVVET